jgi:hypothetical protein
MKYEGNGTSTPKGKYDSREFSPMNEDRGGLKIDFNSNQAKIGARNHLAQSPSRGVNSK